jgi:hypothetical protein
MRAVKLPVWVRIADAAAVACLIVGLFVLLFGGFLVHLGPSVLRVHDPWRIFFLAAAVLAVRHAAHPRDPLHRRLAGVWKQAGGDSPSTAAGIALTSRITVLAVGYLAVAAVGVPDATVGFKVSSYPLVNLPARFDAGWYASIALEGYYFEGRFDKQQNVAFFPALPLLERTIGYPLGAFGPGMPRDKRVARLLWGGVVLSLIAFAWGAVYLWRLARDTIGAEHALDAVTLTAAYPFAVFYSAPYTEAVFLLGCVAAIFHFRREEWLKAAAWGFLVGLTRPNGCFLSVVLACFVVQNFRHKIFTSLASAAAPGLGMLAYSAYVYRLTGVFFGWARLHEAAWGRAYEGLAPVTRAYGWITDEGLLHVVEGIPFDTLNSLGLIFALLMLWPVFRRLGFAYGMFVMINVLPPMLAGGVLSMGRITSTVFPLFFALAVAVPRRMIPPLVTAFAIGQGLAAVLFFTWRPLF